jgi:toxin ParE1/3/4
MLAIAVFGLKAFGPVQARKYASQLKHCFELLAVNPKMGRITVALGANLRRHEHQSHVILYEETETGILVLGIVHKRNLRRLMPH